MATMMVEPRELFVHELGDLLFAENTLIKALPKLAKEASDAELQKGFESHLEETKQHVANLKQVFEVIGEPAKAEKCPAIEGITKEHDEFMSEEKPVACDLRHVPDWLWCPSRALRDRRLQRSHHDGPGAR